MPNKKQVRRKLSAYIFVGTFCLSKVEDKNKVSTEVNTEGNIDTEVKSKGKPSRDKIKNKSKPTYYSFEFCIKKEEGSLPTEEECKDIVKSKIKEVSIYDIDITHFRFTTNEMYKTVEDRLKKRSKFK